MLICKYYPSIDMTKEKSPQPDAQIPQEAEIAIESLADTLASLDNVNPGEGTSYVPVTVEQDGELQDLDLFARSSTGSHYVGLDVARGGLNQVEEESRQLGDGHVGGFTAPRRVTRSQIVASRVRAAK
jgi:hypothetical protein